MMNKKAVELTMNTLIMAILGIVVLFILIAIFSGKITWFGGQYQDIGQRAFECQQPCKPPPCGQGEVSVPLKKCPGTSTGICCEPTGFYEETKTP